MKSRKLLLLLAALTGLCQPWQGFAKVHDTSSFVKPVRGEITRGGMARLAAPAKSKSVSDDLIREDFSKVSEGTISEPDYSAPICSVDPGYSPYVDEAFTQRPGWYGTEVYQAGGAVALRSLDMSQNPAQLCTPLGDYSGELKVSLRVRPVSSAKDGGVGKGSNYLYVNFCKDGYATAEFADTDENFCKFNFYSGPGQEWSTVELTVNNKSSDNDGFVYFYVYGELILDDIEISTTANFIAPPVLEPVTGFNDKGFTLSWQPVRKAFNYYVHLFKRVKTSDEDLALCETFEDVATDGYGLADEWEITQGTPHDYTCDGGVDGSKGIRLEDGDAFTTYFDFSPYKSMNLWLRSYFPNERTEQIDDSHLTLEAFDGDKWLTLSTIMLTGLKEGECLNLEDFTYSGFAGKYTKVRLSASVHNPGVYAVVDNVDFVTGPPPSSKWCPPTTTWARAISNTRW